MRTTPVSDDSTPGRFSVFPYVVRLFSSAKSDGVKFWCPGDRLLVSMSLGPKPSNRSHLYSQYVLAQFGPS